MDARSNARNIAAFDGWMTYRAWLARIRKDHREFTLPACKRLAENIDADIWLHMMNTDVVH